MSDFFIMVVFPAAVLIGGAMWLDSASCESRWKGSGMQTSWGPLQGCLVKRKDGTWVPDKMMRDINQ